MSNAKREVDVHCTFTGKTLVVLALILILKSQCKTVKCRKLVPANRAVRPRVSLKTVIEHFPVSEALASFEASASCRVHVHDVAICVHHMVAKCSKSWIATIERLEADRARVVEVRSATALTALDLASPRAPSTGVGIRHVSCRRVSARSACLLSACLPNGHKRLKDIICSLVLLSYYLQLAYLSSSY